MAGRKEVTAVGSESDLWHALARAFIKPYGLATLCFFVLDLAAALFFPGMAPLCLIVGAVAVLGFLVGCVSQMRDGD